MFDCCVIKWTLVHVCGCASVTIYVRSCVPTMSVCTVCVCVLMVRVGLVCNQMFGWLSYSPIVIGLPCIIAS